LSGVIDKLLITPASNGCRSQLEIIDFKTNRVAKPRSFAANALSNDSHQAPRRSAGTSTPKRAVQQIAFDFSGTAGEELTSISAKDNLQTVARDYHLQMQAYALAVRELIPGLDADIKVTLHFLDPQVEYHLTDELLEPDACKMAIDEAMKNIVSAAHPQHFPVLPGGHCRMCNFLSICTAGKDLLKYVT
jgi:hypothetical protein